MQTIKNFRNAVGFIYLCAALNFAGCKCNGPATPGTDSTKAAGADSTKADSSMKKADSSKMAPVDSATTPPNHLPKKDTSVSPRPLIRKT